MLLHDAVKIMCSRNIGMSKLDQSHGQSLYLIKTYSGYPRDINIDSEIYHAIKIFNDCGILTEQSCQGEFFTSNKYRDWKHNWAGYVLFNSSHKVQSVLQIQREFSSHGFFTEYSMDCYVISAALSYVNKETIKFMGNRNKKFCELLNKISQNINDYL